MPFFPTLNLPGFRRNNGTHPAGDPGRSAEAKVILADYYAALLNSGSRGLHGTARPWPVERAVSEGFDRVVWTFRAVSTIAENGARGDVPFEVVTGDVETPDVVEDHPVSRLLNGKAANEMETGKMFRERLIAQLMLSKRGVFIEVTRSNAGTPIRYDLLPPGRTRIVPSRDAMIGHYEVTRLDGSTYEIDPDLVRWARQPHPIDPYSGVTPLESAGMSVELDYFARLYNVAMMRNDGRPGGVLAIEGDLDEDELDRIEARFGTGPAEAGRLSVLSGKLTYADLAARPRDMAYGQASANAKNEILCAFGTPESVLGNAAERTYANAQAEGYQFWANRMLNTLSRVSDAFMPDLADGERGQFNTSRIQVLQLPEADRRAEARAEFEAGLRSVKSYADLAGYGDEIDDTPYSRALWIPSGRTPMPAHAADAAALGAGGPPPPPPEEAAVQPGPGTSAPLDAVPGSAANTTTGKTEPPLQVPAERVGAPAAAGPAAGTATVTAIPPGPQASQTKALGPGQTKAARSWDPINPADTEPLAAAAIGAALTAQIDRWAARAGTRLRSPRTRRGTRHFVPAGDSDARTGTKALDAAVAVDADSFADDIDEATRSLVEQAALLAAAAWLSAATGEKLTAADLPDALADTVRDSADAAMPALIAGAGWQAARAAQAITEADSAGGTIEDAAAALAERADAVRDWAQAATEDAAGAATEAGYAAASRAHRAGTGIEVQQQWVTREDAKVRATHRKAHGQLRDTEKPFSVGAALLRFPRDPLGPPEETRNCRCGTRWRQRHSGQLAPIDEASEETP